MFESIRDAFRELLQQHPDPDTRRDAIAQMRETLVRARMGVQDLQGALADTEKSVKKEQEALETVQRRRALAEKIGDVETVQLAERYEMQHAERVAVLQRKVVVQRDELAMVEREVSEMTSDFKLASKGGIPGLGSSDSFRENDAAPDHSASGIDDDAADREFSEMDASRRRAAREARADDMLEALKRRMGK